MANKESESQQKPKKVLKAVVNPWITIIAFIGLALATKTTYHIQVLSFMVPLFATMLAITVKELKTAKANDGDVIKPKSEIWQYAIWIAVAILVDITYIYIGTRPTFVNSTPTLSDVVAQDVKETKASYKLPYAVDSVTTLTDITSAGNAIQYHEQIKSADTSSLSESTLRNALLSEGLCTNKDILTMLNGGVDMQYIYTVYETGQQYTVTITKSDC